MTKRDKENVTFKCRCGTSVILEKEEGDRWDLKMCIRCIKSWYDALEI